MTILDKVFDEEAFRDDDKERLSDLGVGAELSFFCPSTSCFRQLKTCTVIASLLTVF